MDAPGQPGIAPTWSSSAKDIVGCALGSPRLWFTTGFGIVNEVYYPRVDIPQIRDLGFIVADGRGFWIEVKRLNTYQLALPGPGIPAPEIVHRHPRFTLRLRITPDPCRDVLQIEVDLQGDPALRPYALLAPHLGGRGAGNRAEVASHRGRRVLWARQGPFALALAAVDTQQADAWGEASAGYVGINDGWQDFARSGTLRSSFSKAGPGNVALCGELPRQAVLALAFSSSPEAAATLAFSSLAAPFADAWAHHIAAWRGWQAALDLGDELPQALHEQLHTSAMVLRAHQDKTYPGAMVASLSIPWGNRSDDLGGYHLVWPRDLVESAGGLLALGAVGEARNILRYLIATQNADGHWAQNQWLGGKPYWAGIQLDEAAFPVLLASALMERNALDGIEARPMVARALAYVACLGPCSDQDRWEEDAGINPFTLAVCIAALVCGADLLPEPGAGFCRRLADFWNSRIENWTFACGTRLAREAGVAGHYVRIGANPGIPGESGLARILPIKNRAADLQLTASEQVGCDFLQLVRLGLRRADDQAVRDSLTVIDRTLKVDTPNGPAWYRYNGDGYGEHDDGAPFDGTGSGRPWPLLTGERGHYEVAAGGEAQPYLAAMAAMAGPGGLIPEQVWDGPPVPARRLLPGRPTGAAMPLVWAHAEFVKLVASRRLGRPFDRPTVVWNRYGGQRPTADHAFWSERLPLRRLWAGQLLCLIFTEPVVVHWGVDGWQAAVDAATWDTGIGIHLAELPTAVMAAGRRIDLTYHRQRDGGWIGRDYRVDVVPGGDTESC